MRFRMPWAGDVPDVETRADGYTDALVSALLRTAQGRSSATVAATGALEAAAGIVGRAFMAADLDGPMTDVGRAVGSRFADGGQGDNPARRISLFD